MPKANNSRRDNQKNASCVPCTYSPRSINKQPRPRAKLLAKPKWMQINQIKNVMLSNRPETRYHARLFYLPNAMYIGMCKRIHRCTFNESTKKKSHCHNIINDFYWTSIKTSGCDGCDLTRCICRLNVCSVRIHHHNRPSCMLTQICGSVGMCEANIYNGDNLCKFWRMHE